MPANQATAGGETSPGQVVEFDATAEVLARAFITTAERSTLEELGSWAENLSLCSSARAAAMDPDSLAARIYLLLLELEHQETGVVQIPSREQLLVRLHPPPKGLAAKDAIRARLAERVDIDGVTFQMPLSRLEERFLETVHDRLRLDAEQPDDWDEAAEQQEVEEIRREVLAAAEPGEDEQSVVVGPRQAESGSSVGDVIHPGPMASFFAFEDAGGPWDLKTEPWRRELRQRVDLRRLRHVLERPSRFKLKEIEKLDMLCPVARARARIVSRRVPTGMSLAVDRIERLSNGEPQDGVLWTPLTDEHWSRDDLSEALIPLAQSLREGGSSAIEALVEMSELVGTAATDDPRFRAAFGAVAGAYEYPRDLPVFSLPNSTAYQDEEVTLADVGTIESWTDDTQLRWILYFVLRRVKGTMDDLRRVRFPSRWIFESKAKADDALPVGSRDRFSQVKPILKRHVWRTLIGHSSGSHSTVYWVLYDFDNRAAQVSREEMEVRWGSPSTRS